MFSSKIIREDNILEEYSAKYERYSGVKVSKVFLNETFLVRGFFNEDEELIGGNVINKGPVLRYISRLPSSERNILDKFNISPEDVAETCCTWIRPDVPEKYRLKIYLYIFMDILITKKRYFLAGTRIPAVRDNNLGRTLKILYEGPWVVEDKKDNYGWVFYGLRRTMLLGMLKELFRRFYKLLSIKSKI